MLALAVSRATRHMRVIYGVSSGPACQMAVEPVQSDGRRQQMVGTARGASATEDATTCQAPCVTCGGGGSVFQAANNEKIYDTSQ